MKYKVINTCHAGGRVCREGEIVDVDLGKDDKGKAITNRHLEPVKAETKVTKSEGPKETLATLGKKPAKVKTGMAAEKKGAPEKEDEKKDK